MTAQRAAALRLPLLCVTVLLGPLVFSSAFTSFLHPKEMVLAAGLLGIAAIGIRAGVNPRAGFRFFLPLWAGWLYLALWHGFLRPPVLWGASLIELARLATLLLLSTLAFDLCRSPRHAAWMIRAIIAGASLCAVLGLLQYFDLVLWLFPRFPHYDQKMYSVFGNQDLLGGYLALALALIPLGRIRGVQDAALRIVAAAPMVAALALCGSRSAWLGAGIGLGIALARMRPRRHAVAAMLLLPAAAAVCIALAPERTLDRLRNTFAEEDVGARVRLWTWDGALRMICAHPLGGVGPANFQFHSPRFMGDALHAPGGLAHYRNALHAVYAESEPLQFSSETGLMGLCFAVWWLWVLLRRRGPAWSGIAALAAVSCFSFPFHSAPHALAGLLLCATLRPRGASHAMEERSPRSFAVARLSLAAALVLVVFLAWAHWLPSMLTARADRAGAANAANADVLPLYEGALDCTPDLFETGELRLHHAIAIARAIQDGRADISPENLEAAIERAAARLDTVQLHQLRGRHYQHRGDSVRALASFRAALYRWPEDTYSRERIEALERARAAEK